MATWCVEPPPPPPANGGVAGSRGEVTGAGAGGWLGAALGVAATIRTTVTTPIGPAPLIWRNLFCSAVTNVRKTCSRSADTTRLQGKEGADFVSFDFLKCTTKLLSISSVDWFTIEHCKVT